MAILKPFVCQKCGSTRVSYPRYKGSLFAPYSECYECGQMYVVVILWKRAIWILPLTVLLAAIAWYSLFHALEGVKQINIVLRFFLANFVMAPFLGIGYMLVSYRRAVEEVGDPELRVKFLLKWTPAMILLAFAAGFGVAFQMSFFSLASLIVIIVIFVRGLTLRNKKP